MHFCLLFLLFLPKDKLISLLASHKCEDTKTWRWDPSCPRSHCIMVAGVSHQLLWVVQQRKTCSSVMCYCHHCTVFQIHSVIIKSSCCLWQAKAMEEEAGPNWLLVLQTPMPLHREELGVSLAVDAPAFWEDTENCGTSILWWFFPDLGVTCKETSKRWESQGEKNSYSPGALAGCGGTWGGHGAKSPKPIHSALSTLWVLLPSSLTLPQLAW